MIVNVLQQDVMIIVDLTQGYNYLEYWSYCYKVLIIVNLTQGCNF